MTKIKNQKIPAPSKTPAEIGFKKRKEERMMNNEKKLIEQVETLEELKQVYKKLALIHHPDANTARN